MSDKEKKNKDEKLLTEPDEVSEEDDSPTNEFSGVGAIAGVTTPLGTGPAYPAGSKRRKKKLRKNWQKSK